MQALRGLEGPIAFDVRREAGTFACSGEAGDGAGGGIFRFHPNAEWSDGVRALGLRFPLLDQVIAVMSDIPLAYIRDIVEAGFKSTSLQRLFMLRLRSITAERARVMWSDFPDADLMSILMLADHTPTAHGLHEALPEAAIDEVIVLAMAGATPEMIHALRAAKVRDLTAANVAALCSVGVDRAFAEQLVASGKTDLSVDDVAALRKSQR